MFLTTVFKQYTTRSRIIILHLCLYIGRYKSIKSFYLMYIYIFCVYIYDTVSRTVVVLVILILLRSDPMRKMRISLIEAYIEWHTVLKLKVF